MKPVYILEARTHKTGRLYPNTVQHVIGTFTTPIKAEKWIETEGRRYCPKHWKKYKNTFWALVESIPNENMNILHKFYDLL